MTNREKYIDNASNEEIASAICGMGLQYRYSPDTQLRVKEWLSQEAEEETVNIPNIGKMPKTDKTKIPSSWDDIRPLIETDENIAMLIKEIIALQERVKELEKYSLIGRNLILTELKTPEINAVPLNGYSSIETKTADEMFKELGYKKEFSDRNGCNYYHKEINRSGVKSEHIIHVLSNESSTLYGKYERLDDKEFAANISVAEDKAIHKKIEELKNG